MEELSKEQLERYSRNILLKGFGQEGQKKLLRSKVLVVGAGGLGSAVAYYLAAAGIGNLGICDPNQVELSNLNRQILHSIRSLGRDKTDSASLRIMEFNPDTDITAYQEKISEKNGVSILNGYDAIADCSDNFETRFLLNDLCVKLSKPLFHGAAVGYLGQAMTIIPGKSPCLRCVFSDVPGEKDVQTSNDIGILGAAAGMIGTVQAGEIVKYLLGSGDLLTGKMFTANIHEAKFRVINIPRDNNCKACKDL
jgi:molybdopterin-synthase adenylyltransferase